VDLVLFLKILSKVLTMVNKKKSITQGVFTLLILLCNFSAQGADFGAAASAAMVPVPPKLSALKNVTSFDADPGPNWSSLVLACIFLYGVTKCVQWDAQERRRERGYRLN
jgi:hypothetical protein